MAWKKLTAIGVGLVMGVSATMVAMVPSASKSEAAIAVFDQENIAQAIKTALTTLDILTEEQAQYALMLLQSKKFDESILTQIMNMHTKQSEYPMDERGAKTGLEGLIIPKGQPLDEKMGTEQLQVLLGKTWDTRMGSLEDILNSEPTDWYNTYKADVDRQQFVNNTFLDAAVQGTYNMRTSNEILEDTGTLIDQSDNAEGEMQAIQAGNALMAQQIYGTASQMRLNTSMALAIMTKYKQEALQEAETLRKEEISRQAVEKFTDGISDASRGL